MSEEETEIFKFLLTVKVYSISLHTHNSFEVGKMNSNSVNQSRNLDFDIDLFVLGSHIKSGKKFLLSYLNNADDDVLRSSVQSTTNDKSDWNHYERMIKLGSFESINTSIWDFTSNSESSQLKYDGTDTENINQAKTENPKQTNNNEQNSTNAMSSYAKAGGFMILYEVSNRQSFHHIYIHLQNIQDFGKSQIPIILVGIKDQSQKQRCVTYEEASSLARSFNIPYLEEETQLSPMIIFHTHLRQILIRKCALKSNLDALNSLLQLKLNSKYKSHIKKSTLFHVFNTRKELSSDEINPNSKDSSNFVSNLNWLLELPKTSKFSEDIYILTNQHESRIAGKLIQDETGQSALHIAAFYGIRSLVTFIMKTEVYAKTILEHTNNQGRTALHVAAMYGHVNVTEQLIGIGADIRSRDIFNCTPLDLAKNTNQLETFNILYKAHGTQSYYEAGSAGWQKLQKAKIVVIGAEAKRMTRVLASKTHKNSFEAFNDLESSKVLCPTKETAESFFNVSEIEQSALFSSYPKTNSHIEDKEQINIDFSRLNKVDLKLLPPNESKFSTYENSCPENIDIFRETSTKLDLTMREIKADENEKPRSCNDFFEKVFGCLEERSQNIERTINPQEQEFVAQTQKDNLNLNTKYDGANGDKSSPGKNHHVLNDIVKDSLSPVNTPENIRLQIWEQKDELDPDNILTSFFLDAGYLYIITFNVFDVYMDLQQSKMNAGHSANSDTASKETSWSRLLRWIDVTTCKANSSMMQMSLKSMNREINFLFAGFIDGSVGDSKEYSFYSRKVSEALFHKFHSFPWWKNVVQVGNSDSIFKQSASAPTCVEEMENLEIDNKFNRSDNTNDLIRKNDDSINESLDGSIVDAPNNEDADLSFYPFSSLEFMDIEQSPLLSPHTLYHANHFLRKAVDKTIKSHESLKKMQPAIWMEILKGITDSSSDYSINSKPSAGRKIIKRLPEIQRMANRITFEYTSSTMEGSSFTLMMNFFERLGEVYFAQGKISLAPRLTQESPRALTGVSENKQNIEDNSNKRENDFNVVITKPMEILYILLHLIEPESDEIHSNSTESPKAKKKNDIRRRLRQSGMISWQDSLFLMKDEVIFVKNVPLTIDQNKIRVLMQFLEALDLLTVTESSETPLYFIPIIPLSRADNFNSTVTNNQIIIENHRFTPCIICYYNLENILGKELLADTLLNGIKGSTINFMGFQTKVTNWKLPISINSSRVTFKMDGYYLTLRHEYDPTLNIDRIVCEYSCFDDLYLSKEKKAEIGFITLELLEKSKRKRFSNFGRISLVCVEEEDKQRKDVNNTLSSTSMPPSNFSKGGLLFTEDLLYFYKIFQRNESHFKDIESEDKMLYSRSIFFKDEAEDEIEEINERMNLFGNKPYLEYVKSLFYWVFVYESLPQSRLKPYPSASFLSPKIVEENYQDNKDITNKTEITSVDTKLAQLTGAAWNTPVFVRLKLSSNPYSIKAETRDSSAGFMACDHRRNRYSARLIVVPEEDAGLFELVPLSASLEFCNNFASSFSLSSSLNDRFLLRVVNGGMRRKNGGPTVGWYSTVLKKDGAMHVLVHCDIDKATPWLARGGNPTSITNSSCFNNLKSFETESKKLNEIQGAIIGTVSECRFRSITVGSAGTDNDENGAKNNTILDRYKDKNILPVTLQSHAEVEEEYAAFAKWNIDIVPVEMYPDTFHNRNQSDGELVVEERNIDCKSVVKECIDDMISNLEANHTVSTPLSLLEIDHEDYNSRKDNCHYQRSYFKLDNLEMDMRNGIEERKV